MRGHMVAFGAGLSLAIIPAAFEAQIPLLLGPNVVVACMLIESLAVCKGSGAIFPFARPGIVAWS